MFIIGIRVVIDFIYSLQLFLFLFLLMVHLIDLYVMETTGKGILNQLDSLMEDVICALQTTEGNLPLIWDKNLAGGTEGVTADDEVVFSFFDLFL